MGSAILKSPGIQNKIEEEIRQKELESREHFRINFDEHSKSFDLDRELLGAFSQHRKRDKQDHFDTIVPTVEDEATTAKQDSLVIILCNNETRKLKIKASLQQLFTNKETVRWPDFKLDDEQNSLHFGVRENLCHKVIGYTTFFLFYGVMSDKLSQSQIEMDINRTVEYFAEYHRGALHDVPKLFVFELPHGRNTYKTENSVSNTTIYVVSGGEEGLTPIGHELKRNDSLS